MTKIDDLFGDASPTISFEFFPPKDASSAKQFAQALDDIAAIGPDFVSITYGAQGSDRQRTRDIVLATQANFNFPAMAHLTCVGHTTAEIDALLDRYVAGGVQNILALGGDIPLSGVVPQGDFRHASDLVAHLRSRHDLSIGVAAHPEGHPRSTDLTADRKHLAAKLNEADFAVTQFFFDVDHYRSLVDDLSRLGCDRPVIPGVIPITNAAQVKRFAAMSGATIPAGLATRIDAAGDNPERVREVGVAAAAALCHDLLEAGAPGLHLYSLNRSEPALAVLNELGLAKV
ncbi:MAG: methylenetetrahydrofolate reductase [Acidimicrobiales bacterium]